MNTFQKIRTGNQTKSRLENMPPQAFEDKRQNTYEDEARQDNQHAPPISLARPVTEIPDYLSDNSRIALNRCGEYKYSKCYCAKL